MKKIILLLIGVVTLFSATAQIDPMMPVPVDPAVRVGTLKNGMRYYIRHNEKPKNQANFYILHNVGAIQEGDHQQGLAHFLEHMAFNGTKNLPGKQMITYLESQGVKFGADLNASTGFDQTIYNVNNVQTNKPGLVDTTLLILHDWSRFIDLQPAEIDAERGVISEELRTTETASWRSMLAMMDAVHRGSKYTERNIIGHLDGLRSFSYQDIEDFYHDWYHPGNQAIVIVGDLDVDQIEAKLIKLMADIPASPADAPQKVAYPAPDNEEPIVSIFSDPEQTYSRAAIFYRRQAPPVEANGLMIRQMIDTYDTFTSYIFNLRLLETSLQPDAPFIGGNMNIGNVTGMNPSQEQTAVLVQTREGEILTGFEAMMTEIEKMRRYGFTQGELDRAKAAMLSNIETQYASRNDRTNAQFIWTYLNNYSYGTAMPSAEETYRIDKQMVEMITLEDLNQWAAQLITDKNRIVMVDSPAKEGLVIPSASDMIRVMDEVRNSEVAGYTDTDLSRPLIPAGTKLKGSKVKKHHINGDLEVTEWTLKNGVRIRVKPNTVKADEVMFHMTSKGGVMSLPTEQMTAALLLSPVINTSGIGDFTGIELKKKLEDKNSALNLSLSAYEHGMAGSASPKDLETMLQVLYMAFTQPRWSEDAFNTVMGQYRQYLQNAEANPDYTMAVERQKTIFGNNPRRQEMTLEMLEGVKFEMMEQIGKKFYSDARDFTFTFVGNVDLETLKPLVEKYIGSLPVSNDGVAGYTDDGVRAVSGVVTNEFTTPMMQPKVGEYLMFHADADAYTIKNNVTLQLLRQALNVRYLQSIREEKGGTYGVRVSSELTHYPVAQYGLYMSFDTNEAMAEELAQIIVEELRTIAENGPIREDVDNGKQFMVKSFDTALESNGVWFQIMENYYEMSHENMLKHYKQIVESVSYDDIQNLAKKLLDSQNLIHVSMRPAK